MNSLISQIVFDNTNVDISSVGKLLIIPIRVSFDIRMNADGTVKYLVAQGNQDTSTFLILSQVRSVRTINIYLLCIEASEDLEISTIDKNCFFIFTKLYISNVLQAYLLISCQIWSN